MGDEQLPLIVVERAVAVSTRRSRSKRRCSSRLSLSSSERGAAGSKAIVSGSRKSVNARTGPIAPPRLRRSMSLLRIAVRTSASKCSASFADSSSFCSPPAMTLWRDAVRLQVRASGDAATAHLAPGPAAHAPHELGRGAVDGANVADAQRLEERPHCFVARRRLRFLREIRPRRVHRNSVRRNETSMPRHGGLSRSPQRMASGGNEPRRADRMLNH
jgi:hypothetical protein